MPPSSFLRAAARCWESAGHFDRAAERFARADAWADAGRCWALAGRPVEAANAYARAGEPIDEARQWLASPWPERARRPYRQALGKGLQPPTEVEALLGLGEIGLASDRAFDVASESGRSSEALLALARLAAARGRPDLAARAWDQAIALNPVAAREAVREWQRAARWNRSLAWKRPPAGVYGWPSREFRDVRLELVWDAPVGTVRYGNRALSWSAGGRRVAAVTHDGLILLDLTGREVRHHSIQSNTYSVAFVPGSDSVLIGGSDGQVVRVDPSGEKYELRQLRMPGEVWSVALSPLGDQLAISSAISPGASLRVWSWSAQGPRELLWEEKTHEGTANPCCAWSPDGQVLAWCPSSWNTSTVPNDLLLFTGANRRCVPEAHGNSVNGIAFSPDGRYLVTASNDCTLVLRDSGHGEAIIPVWRSSTNLKTVVWHPHAALLAAAGSEGIGRFGSASRCYFLRFVQNQPPHLEVLQEMPTEAGVRSVAFSPDGEYLLMITNDGLSLFRVHLL